MLRVASTLTGADTSTVRVLLGNPRLLNFVAELAPSSWLRDGFCTASGPDSSSSDAAPSPSSSPSSPLSPSDQPPSVPSTSSKLTFITQPASETRSGYAESRLPDSPPTPLRTSIRQVQEEQAEVEEGTKDFYQLSRSLFTDEEFTKTVGVNLDEESAKTLNKLVGCLTKEGKKSQAFRIVLDAMAIIRENMEQQQAQQASK